MILILKARVERFCVYCRYLFIFVHSYIIEDFGACIYVIVRIAFVKKCIHKLSIIVGARLVGGVVGVVERLALSSGAFLPPKMLASYIANHTRLVSLVNRCKYFLVYIWISLVFLSPSGIVTPPSPTPPHTAHSI